MKLTIKGINRKPMTTKYGDTNKVGITTLEYPEKWLNGWEDGINLHWKKGDVVEAIVSEDDYGLKFKAQPCAPTSLSSQTARVGMVKEKTNEEDKKWDRISFGKCKHAFLLEAYKMGAEPNEFAEKQAEEWAKMSMRILSDQTDSPENWDEEVRVENIPFGN
jgi:hypothetical protein